MDIFRPTLKQIKDCMVRQYQGGVREESIPPNESPLNWFFTVYIPNNLDTLYIEVNEELQEIFELFKNMRLECGIYENYNFIKGLSELKKNKLYSFHSEYIEYFDWFILLSICVANNFIVDSKQINICECSSIIYDIEPATPRLKVRIP